MAKVLYVPREGETKHTEIDGVKYTETADGLLSDDMSDEAAERLLTIPGFQPTDSGRSRKEALLKRAAELGVAVSTRWGVDKLKEAVDLAEQAAADGKNKAPVPLASKAAGDTPEGS